MKHLSKSLLDRLSYEIIGAVIEVHRQLGPGLLESIYHECLRIELIDRGLDVETEMKVPVYYNERKLETTLRCDLFVAGLIVVELKSVKALDPIFEAQLMTYMKLLDAPKGILINFNCLNIFREGQKTIVGELYSKLPH